jgi:hypothetical protein
VYGVTNNIAYVGEADEDTNDSTISLDANLPFEKQTGRTTIRLKYWGRLTRFDRAQNLDHTEHTLDLETEFRTGRKSSVGFTVFGERTQRVADATNVRDDNVFIEQRINRTAYGASLNLAWGLGGRWRGTASFAATESTAEAIQDVETEQEAKDYSSYLVTFYADKTISARTTQRFRYTFRVFDSDAVLLATDASVETVQESVHQIDYTYDRTVSRRSTVGLLAGAFIRQREDETDLQQQGLALGVTYSYGPFSKTNFGTSLAVAPSSGGNLGGTSTNAIVTVALTSVESRKLNWGLNWNYTRRFAAVTTDPDVATIMGFGFVEPIVHRDLAIRFTARWARQTSEIEDVADGEFVTLGLGLVWYPLLGTRLGNRG